MTWFQDFRLPGFSGEQRVAVGLSPISTDGPPGKDLIAGGIAAQGRNELRTGEI